MKEKRNRITTYFAAHKGAFLTSLTLLLLVLLLLFCARNIKGFSTFYSVHLFPVLPGTLGRLLSPLPFSLFEWLICGALVAGLSLLVFTLFRLFTPRGRKQLGRLFSRLLPVVLCTFCILLFMQTLTCLIHYDRLDFGEEAGIATYTAGSEDLKALCLLLISDLEESLASPSMEAGLDLTGFDTPGAATAAMKKLGQEYPSLSGYYPRPKAMFFSPVMSMLSLTGIFSPYTTEPNYNNRVVSYVIPYTVCHELAHAKGYIKENEAGFIAYLACAGADSPQLRYSGALNGLSYSLNALYRSVPEAEYQEILRQVPAQALKDLQDNQAYWQQFRQGIQGVISETARAANDNYLKANAQADGSKSYGRMVDLLLAYYKIGAEEI